MRILHVIRQVTNGGASLGLLNMCRHGPSGAHHAVLSLTPSSAAGLARFASAGIDVIHHLTEIAFDQVDLVQVEWWNTPEMVRFLLSGLAPCRILLHSRAHFDAPYMCPSRDLLSRVDAVTVSTPSSAGNRVFAGLAADCGLPETRTIYSAAVSDRAAAPPRPLAGRLGYLGTIEHIKMHRRALPMIASILDALPGVTFEFAGEGPLDQFRAEADALGVSRRVHFLGFVDDPWRFLESLDMLFYPLNPWTYATSEKSVQEAMMAGTPVAAFPYGGLRDLLTSRCALLCSGEDALAAGTIALMQEDGRRRRLARAAQRRLSDWPPARDWRLHAKAAWLALLERPKHARQAVHVESDREIFKISHAPDAWSSDGAGTRADFEAVANFVLENYT